jgi:broad specificity phosphatase PhoE
MSSETILYLVRHGATPYNEARPVILQGSGIDGPLSEQGRRQAAAVAEALATRPLAAVYSSRMARARETATTIAGQHQLDVPIVEGLQEINAGRWEGCTWPRILEEYPDDYHRFMADPINVPYLEGESYRHVLDRALPALTQLLERHSGQSIAVVAHNVVNKMVLTHTLGLPLSEARRLRQDNCCVNVLSFHAGLLQVVTVNSTLHLP